MCHTLQSLLFWINDFGLPKRFLLKLQNHNFFDFSNIYSWWNFGASLDVIHLDSSFSFNVAVSRKRNQVNCCGQLRTLLWQYQHFGFTRSVSAHTGVPFWMEAWGTCSSTAGIWVGRTEMPLQKRAVILHIHGHNSTRHVLSTPMLFWILLS